MVNVLDIPKSENSPNSNDNINAFIVKKLLLANVNGWAVTLC